MTAEPGLTFHQDREGVALLHKPLGRLRRAAHLLVDVPSAILNRRVAIPSPYRPLSSRSAVSPSSHCAKSVPTTTAHLQRGPCSRSSVYPRSPAWLISPSAFSRCVSMRPSPLPRRRPAPSVSAFCPRGFVRRSGMIHSPAPAGRALSHPLLVILLQYLRAPPRHVSGERPRAFVVMEKIDWSRLVYDGSTPSSRRRKRRFHARSVLSCYRMDARRREQQREHDAER